ncbi:MAG: sensor histidine kinase [Phycisphaerales bacterium JB064]
MRVRRIIPWLLYAVCALAVLEGLGYAGYKALDLQRQRREDEAVRLALWRMDSALTAVLAAESARPYFHYRPFHAAERAYSAMLGPVEPGEVLVPSPLLTQVPPFVRLHFEVEPDGTLTSPQAPTGNLRDLAEAEYVAADDVIAAEALRLMLADLLQTRVAVGDTMVGLSVAPAEETEADWFARNEFAAAAQLAEAPLELETASRERSQTRDESVGRGIAMPEPAAQRVPQAQQRRTPETKTAVELPEVHLGPLAASWLAGDQLVLMREVRVGDTTLRQGVWLDWPSLHDWLLSQVRDLTPDAELRPGGGEPRSLAVIPATLAMEAEDGVLAELASPLGVVLVLTWVAALFAVVAIGIVLRLATSLAERRGRFVSAVTHELRTPMTSVRLYADLLASDAARDDERRGRFVTTLREESARLARIIENVLAYARLGRPNGNGESHKPTVGEVVERAVREQSQALDRSALEAKVDIEMGVADRSLDADGDAVVRILGNLIENACKYASPSEHPIVEVRARAEGSMAMFTVRDFGPGVPARERRRIFEAFHRSARDEMRESGLGLGLALSRGLAKQMGGQLSLDEVSPGASFTLTVPLTQAR